MGPCWRLSAPGQRYETLPCGGNRLRPDALSRAHAGVGLKHLDLSGDLALGIVRAFDASPNPYVPMTPDLRFAGMNRAFLDVVGRAREELVDRPIFDILDGGGSSDKAVENARQLRESLERVFTSGQRDHLALSHTHDLLTRSHWEGAALFDVLRHETEAHGRRRVALHGPPVELKPAPALALGMIFHELATNAAKYGALSVSDGRVAVTWTLGEGSLSLVWRETGGPSAGRPERRGFGSRLIERSVRHDLAGEIETDYGQSGLVASLTIPAESGRA